MLAASIRLSLHRRPPRTAAAVALHCTLLRGMSSAPPPPRATQPRRPPRRAQQAAAAPAAAAFHNAASPAAAVASASTPPAAIQSACDREKQSEELEVLRAIYPDEMKDLSVTEAIAAMSTPAAAASSASSYACAFRIDLGSGFTAVALLPCDYPSHRAPLFHLSHSSRALTGPELAALDEMRRTTLYDSTPEPEEREVVLFNCIDFVRSHIVEPAAATAATAAASTNAATLPAASASARQSREDADLAAALEASELEEDARQRVSSFTDGDDADPAAAESYEYKPYVAASASSGSASAAAGSAISIRSGLPVTDRKSTFLAHVACVSCVADVRAVLAELRSQSKIARASHPAIFAYVITEPATGAAVAASAASGGGGGIIRRESDDCGESGAGARLSHLLERMGVSNMIVVVTRWYGGVQLGADRWRHINHVARTVIEEQLAAQAQAQAAAAAKNATKGKKGKHG